MGLGFLVPAFLAGLAALAVPIVLHLRHRERDRPHRFPSLMFLRRIPIRTAHRRRITDWLLLLLRAGVFALLVAAFTRPYLGRATAAEQAARARAVVLLVDRSLSMGYQGVWPAALDSARRIVAGLGPADRVAVVAFDEEPAVLAPLTTDHAAAAAALEGLTPGGRGTRYAAALRAARQLLADARGLRGEILLVTDLQRSGLAGLAGLALPAGVEVRTVVPGPRSRPNTALIGADVQRVVDGERGRLLVAARLTGRELDAPRSARLTLSVNGRPAASREVTIPVNGAVTAAFDAVPLPPGSARAVISLDADRLPGDDSLRFVVAPEDVIRLILVPPPDAPADETLFFERALAIGREPRVLVERRPRLDQRTLAGARVVVLFDTPLPGGPLHGALQSWVQNGGGLVVAMGARLGARAVRDTLLPGTARGLVERLEVRGGTLGEIRLDHPVFAPFKGGGQAALGAARFLRYPRLDPAPGSDVLARFDDGNPAVVERAAARGRTLIVAAPLDGLTGDFPLQPAYLPFLRRLALYAAGLQPAPLWRATGETGIVPEGLSDPVIATPGGALIRPASDSAPCSVELADPGFYAVYEGRAAGEPRHLLAADPPPAESDLTPADPRELLLGVERGDSAAAAQSAPPAPAEREGRQRLWRILLLLAGVLLAVESIVANRGWRARASLILPARQRGSTQ